MFESGRPAEAARLFEGSTREYAEYTPSRQARTHAWHLTHAGMAHAADGDTAALAVLAERVETVGARSSYARDQRLHHYLRALVARAREAPESEIEQHLRAALYSMPHGFSRINLELAESLLRQGRHEEAAAVAGATLRNSSGRIRPDRSRCPHRPPRRSGAIALSVRTLHLVAASRPI